MFKQVIKQEGKLEGSKFTTKDKFGLRALLNTPTKIRILENLKECKTVKELIKSMKVPRDTVKPHIRHLTDLHLIKKVKNGYRLTDIGIVLLDKVKELEGLVELIEKHGEFFATHDLSSIPKDLLKDIYLLKDCKIFTKDNPFQIRLDWAEVARKSKWNKVVYPIFHPEPLRLCPTLAEGKEEFKVIVPNEVFEKFKTLYPDVLKKCMDVAEFYLCEKATEGFWVSDRQLTLYLFRNGVLDPFNVLICNSKEGIEWGSRLFESYLKRSVRIA